MSNIKTRDSKMLISFIVSIVGILVLAISILFLPYITAVGDLADYINAYSDTIAIKDSDVTLGDLENVTFISVRNVEKSIYSEEGAKILDIFLIVFASFAIFTMLFIILKKPIVAIIGNLLSCGVFLFVSKIIKDVYIADNKYSWGIGYYAILIALTVIIIGLILMLIFKTIQKKQQKLIKDQF